jgi:hypothetical protein
MEEDLVAGSTICGVDDLKALLRVIVLGQRLTLPAEVRTLP